jgi:hypothetical protein
MILPSVCGKFLISIVFKGPWPPATAVNEFKKQFRAKTSTDWANKKGMTAKKGDVSKPASFESAI